MEKLYIYGNIITLRAGREGRKMGMVAIWTERGGAGGGAGEQRNRGDQGTWAIRRTGYIEKRC